MVILENVHPGLILDGVVDVFREFAAFIAQTVNGIGGTRAVALLAIAGFILGLLACMYEIKTIKR